jgi:hypothetical protein
MIDMIFIADICFNFFTGVILDSDDTHDTNILVGEYAAAKTRRGVNSNDLTSGCVPASGSCDGFLKVEYDRKLVALNYGSSWFVLDVVSGVPFALLELILESGTGGQTSSLKVGTTSFTNKRPRRPVIFFLALPSQLCA